jgi:hypothetical protein
VPPRAFPQISMGTFKIAFPSILLMALDGIEETINGCACPEMVIRDAKKHDTSKTKTCFII